ncbi:MAG: hypothetical protein EOO20_06920 [Chryseobacterium sp.]|nr:MAG: hypothetical protein EOO20_06920 [Chryseobacterium sp.]
MFGFRPRQKKLKINESVDVSKEEIVTVEELKKVKRAADAISIYLRDKGIPHLQEFSGRRGFHIWIIFDNSITKQQGYELAKLIETKVKLEDSVNLDLFPKTWYVAKTSKGIGSGVKLPLSVNKNSQNLSYLYKRIFDAVPEKLVQVIPAKINGKTNLSEFLVQEFVHAADKMLDKIRSINEINDENKYNDLLEVILESRIYHYGWSVSGQHRGGFSGKTGPQPGERDLPVMGADTKILAVGEALIYRAPTTAISHLSKMFNYYHQRENLIIIYYNICDNVAFDKRWKDYDAKIISQCTFPNGYELNAPFQDVSADFKSRSSAKVGKTGHESGSVIHHIFLQISYNV